MKKILLNDIPQINDYVDDNICRTSTLFQMICIWFPYILMINFDFKEHPVDIILFKTLRMVNIVCKSIKELFSAIRTADISKSIWYRTEWMKIFNSQQLNLFETELFRTGIWFRYRTKDPQEKNPNFIT
jgi:hypothetical protein